MGRIYTTIFTALLIIIEAAWGALLVTGAMSLFEK